MTLEVKTNKSGLLKNNTKSKNKKQNNNKNNNNNKKKVGPAQLCRACRTL